MKKVKILLVIVNALLLCGISYEGKTQNTIETGFEYALEKLQSLSVAPKWGNKLFEEEYNRYLLKADNYIAKLTQKESSNPKVAIYKQQLGNYKNIYETNTQQDANKVSSSELNGSTDFEKQQNVRVLEMQKQQAAMQSQWEASQASQYNNVDDNGTPNTVHAGNVGKLLFGSYKYGVGNADFISKVTLETPFQYHLFLPQSIENLSINEFRNSRDRRWQATTDNALQFVIKADGKLTHQWLEINPDSAESNTYYTGRCMTEEKLDFYSSSGFYRYYGQTTILENLKPGSHKIDVEVFLYNKTIGESGKVKIADGSFNVFFTQEEWTKLDKERNIKPQQREYRIDCLHSISLRTSPTGLKSEFSGKGSTISYSNGQKIYVFNPKNNTTKYLTTLESASQPIYVTKEFCSY